MMLMERGAGVDKNVSQYYIEIKDIVNDSLTTAWSSEGISARYRLSGNLLRLLHPKAVLVDLVKIFLIVTDPNY